MTQSKGIRKRQTMTARDRRHAILILYAEGLLYKEIAHRLSIAIGTVQNDLWQLRGQYSARNGPHLVTRAFQLGVLKVQENTQNGSHSPLEPREDYGAPRLCGAGAKGHDPL